MGSHPRGRCFWFCFCGRRKIEPPRLGHGGSVPGSRGRAHVDAARKDTGSVRDAAPPARRGTLVAPGPLPAAFSPGRLAAAPAVATFQCAAGGCTGGAGVRSSRGCRRLPTGRRHATTMPPATPQTACQLATVPQFDCALLGARPGRDGLQGDRIVCRPIERIFHRCQNRPAVEVTHLVYYDAAGQPHLPPEATPERYASLSCARAPESDRPSSDLAESWGCILHRQ